MPRAGPRGLGRGAAQDPLAVDAPLEVAARHQLAQGGRDGGPARADHAGERPVREPQRDEHAVRDHAAPALGEAPQEREQAVVHAREVRDGLHHDEPLGAPGGTVDEAGEHLGPLRGAHGERVVDDGDARRGERAPLDGPREQLLVLRVVPGTHQVARSEQLRGRVVSDRRLADEQPLEQEQPDRAAALEEPRIRDPATARDVDHAGVEALPGLARPSRVEIPSEVGVDGEQLDRARAYFWHAVTFQIRGTGGVNAGGPAQALGTWG